MENVANWIFNAMVMLLLLGFGAYVHIRSKMKDLELSLNKRMDTFDRKIGNT